MDDDLGEAYRKAGTTFNMQMRQTFVVLKEESGTRTAALASCGRGGYVPAQRGAPYRGRGMLAPRGGGGRGRGFAPGNPDRRGEKRGGDEIGAGSGYGFASNKRGSW